MIFLKIYNYFKIKNFYFLTLLIPINFIKNLFKEDFLNSVFSVNYFNLISTVLLFIYFYLVSRLINDLLSFKNISLGVVIYVTSFFILDYLILFFNREFSFENNFIIVNFIWLLAFIFKKGNKTILIITSLTLFFLNFIYASFAQRFDLNINISGDVEAVFYPQSKLIFENSYYYSIFHPVIEGYPQFTSYIQAVNYKLFTIGGNTFEYFPATTNVFILLTILFFFEIRISNIKKIFISATYLSLILNNNFLDYLFSNSLMSEGLVSYFFIVMIASIINNVKNRKIIKIILFFAGWLIFSKQFLSTLIVLFLLFICLKYLNYKYLLFSFAAMILRQLSYLTHFKGLDKDHHLTQIDLKDTILDVFLFRDLNFFNALEIFNNLIKDIPTSLVFFLSITICFIEVINEFDLKSIYLIYFLIILINLILILILYISAWRNMELESPIRYILNLLPLYLISIYQNNENKFHI